MLNTFKTFDADRMQLDELLSLEAFGHGLRESYERMQVETPAYVNEKLEEVRRAIRARNADALAAQVKQLEQKLNTYKSVSEKKIETKQALAAAKKKLATVGG